MFFVLCSSVFGLNSTEISALRARSLQNKSSLSASDSGVIDKFVRDGLDELHLEEDLWEAVNVRNAIIAQSGGVEASPYRSAFVDSMRKNLMPALDDVRQLPDANRRMRMELNLLIIAASLRHMDLADVGLSMSGSSNATVRYWAVQTVANSDVARQLKSPVTGDEELTTRIVQGLEKVAVAGTYPETLRLIVEFADELGTAEARVLLVKVADLRIAGYGNWKVKYELMDGILLSAIGKQILTESNASEKEKLWRKFGQLYSYVIERYILGEKVLRVEQKQQLASVIVAVENGVISKFLGRSENRLKKAVEGRKLTALESQRKFLLGSATQAGQLPTRLGVDYGKDAGGNVVTGPKNLKPPVVPAAADN
jgi:hypothetical protein